MISGVLAFFRVEVYNVHVDEVNNKSPSNMARGMGNLYDLLDKTEKMVFYLQVQMCLSQRLWFRSAANKMEDIRKY